jgi:hypothetical protein
MEKRIPHNIIVINIGPVDLPVRNDNRRTIPNAIGKYVAVFIAFLESNLPPATLPIRLARPNKNNAKVKVFPDIFVTVPRYSAMKLLILELAEPII